MLHQEMLTTIRIPKNLLYLTERLPKPHYSDRQLKSKTIVHKSKTIADDDDKIRVSSTTELKRKAVNSRSASPVSPLDLAQPNESTVEPD